MSKATEEGATVEPGAAGTAAGQGVAPGKLDEAAAPGASGAALPAPVIEVVEVGDEAGGALAAGQLGSEPKFGAFERATATPIDKLLEHDARRRRMSVTLAGYTLATLEGPAQE